MLLLLYKRQRCKVFTSFPDQERQHDGIRDVRGNAGKSEDGKTEVRDPQITRIVKEERTWERENVKRVYERFVTRTLVYVLFYSNNSL